MNIKNLKLLYLDADTGRQCWKYSINDISYVYTTYKGLPKHPVTNEETPQESRSTSFRCTDDEVRGSYPRILKVDRYMPLDFNNPIPDIQNFYISAQLY